MKKLVVSGLLMIVLCKTFAQCPFLVQLNSSGYCPGDTLRVSPGNSISKIVWFNGSSAVGINIDIPPNTGITIAGGNGFGSNANQFFSPQSVYGDLGGNIYVVDMDNYRVQKFPPGSTGATNGTTVAGGNGDGSASNQFSNPTGLYVDGAGDIYVVDLVNERIQEWIPGANVGITVAGGNGAGSAANQLNYPSGVFVDVAGNVYVADYVNERIQKWPPGATSGITVAGGNGAGNAANQFNSPCCVFVDASGNIYVTDRTNDRIQKWSPGATTGVTVAGGNGIGSAANQLAAPYGLYVDKNGNLYVADAGNNRIQKFPPGSTGATNGITVAGGNGHGAGANQLDGPGSVYVNAQGNIFVADVNNQRIQEFSQQTTIDTTYLIITPGTYTAAVTDHNGCTVTTNTIMINPAVTPSINIDQSAASLCTASPAFTAIAVDGGALPAYQWQVNGISAGTNSTAFTGNNLANGSVVSCILTSNASCAIASTVTSNLVTVKTPPPITLKSTGGNCSGIDTLFVVTSDSLSKIVWYNGTSAVTTNNSIPVASRGVTVAGGNGLGTDANQFYSASAVFVDQNGNLFVADNNNARVQKFPAGSNGSTNGITVAGGHGQGPGSNQLNQPGRMYVDGNGNIYVPDAGNNRVQKWAPGAGNGVTVAGGNGQGSAANQLYVPGSVYVDAAGNLYISDEYNSRVQKWAPGAISGTTVAGGNGGGSAPNQLSNPCGGAYVDNAGNVYIADAKNNRVQKWAPGAVTGITVAGGNGQGAAANQLSSPVNVFVDGNGNIYIVDFGNTRIQKWTPGATSGTTVAGVIGPGGTANQLSGPVDIYVDSAGYVYVADWSSYQVLKWPQITTIDTTYLPATPGIYTAVVTDNAGCSVTTNAITISPSAKTEISISATNKSICKGAPVTITATAINGGTSPTYQWRINGNVISATGSVFTSSDFANGDIINCISISSILCALPARDTSNSIMITVSPAVIPSVVIDASSSSICQGSQVTFTATPVNAGPSPTFEWQVNGSGTGPNSSIFSNNNFSNNDIVRCVMTSSAGCAANPVATSNDITMHVSSVTAPSLQIIASTTTICAGDSVLFTAVPSNVVGSSSYQWQINGNNNGTDSSIFITSLLANGDVVNCILTGNLNCASSIASANTITMVVNPLPFVYAGNDTIIAPGKSVQFDPSVTGTIVSYLWTPPTGLDNPSVLNSVATPKITTAFRLTVATDAGCMASGKITIVVYSAFRMPNAFTPGNNGRNDIFRIPPSAPQKIRQFSVYSRWGELLFSTSNSANGWNGTFNGKPQPAGTYAWVIEYEDIFTGKPAKASGTVILIK